MTLVAGIYSRHADHIIPDGVCATIQRALSRYPNEQTEYFRDDRCYLVKADVGAYVDPALLIDRVGISFMAGEPLLSSPGAARSRTADLVDLHADLSRNRLQALKRARGVFCVAHYEPESADLVLVTDKLGLRPMYYWLGERYVVFSTTIRVIQQVAQVPKVMDLRGVTETFCLDYPLSDRTPFASVKLLKSGEILRVRGEESSRQQYWRWDEIETSARPLADLAVEAYRVFGEAVALRSRNDTTTGSFLSGGLDSRSIVMALVQQGLKVHSFNFSITGSQDQVFGAEFARLAGTKHTEHPRERGRRISDLMPETWQASLADESQLPERPGIVWSGNGGSITLGHVYLTPEMVALARQADIDGAARLYGAACTSTVPLRLLKPQLRESLSRVVNEGLRQELEDLQCADPGRRLYLFLMHNDQRRHSAELFEDIDLNRLEYHLPFFDSEFVTSVLRVPLDACLGHGFYMRWLRLFPKIVLSVPWQAYPGHEPCPLVIAKDLGYQWEAAEVARVRKGQREARVRQASQVLRAPDFPDALLQKNSLRIAAWLYRLRLRDVGHVITAAHTYYRYWSQCAGNYLAPNA